MPPFNAASWTELVLRLQPDCRLQPAASGDALENLEQWLGTPLPHPLRELLQETDGVSGKYGETFIWSAGEIHAQKFTFRKNPEFRSLYMPFDHLLFFGDNGGGDRFALAIHADGRIHKDDVYRWSHETDAREWYAGRLERFLETYLVDEAEEG